MSRRNTVSRWHEPGNAIGLASAPDTVQKPGRLGVSLAEMVLVLAVLGLLFAVAMPRFFGSRDALYVSLARRAFASSHALARQVAAQYGRTSKLHIDPDANAVWVTVDTSVLPWGGGVEDTVREVVYISDLFGGTKIDAASELVCFDPHGLATSSGDCPLPNTTVVLSRGGAVDSIALSRLGRLWVKR